MRKLWLVLREAGEAFITDHGMKLSASLSYYTVFSIGPMLVIVISLAGIFFGPDAVEGKIFYQIRDFVGDNAALQVQQIIENIQESQLSASGAIVGLIILFVGATGVFTEIQDSINFIWSIRSKPKRGFVKLILNRVLSFSLIISFGFVLLVSLALHALVDLLYERLTQYFADSMLYLFMMLNYAILFAVITLLFSIIFKVLPDARIKWQDSMLGAAFTALLFLLGKFLIGLYVSHSSIGVTYGTAASVIIILVWVYYSSIILFFGAEVTKVYTLRFGHGMWPNETAVFIIKQEARELDVSGKKSGA